MMEQILSALLEVSIYATVLIAAILLFRTLFYSHISPKLQYLLWGLVLLRLMIPVTFESGFHVESLFPAPVAAVAQVSPVAVATPAPVIKSDASPAVIADPAPAAVAPRELTPAQTPVDWQAIVFAVWISGVVLTLSFTAYARIRFASRLRRSAVPSSETAKLLFSGCLASQGVRGNLMLLTTRMAISPSLAMLSGRSVLLLPDRLTDARALRYAILHEVTHYQRRDHWMLLLWSLLRAVYWFNPFLWLACSEMRADMETACDARVLSILEPTEKKGYLTTLLQLFTSDLQPSVGMAQVQTRRMAKKRMKGAFMKQTTSKPMMLTAIIFTVLLVVLCFTTACQAAPDKANFEPIATESPASDAPVASPGNGDEFSVTSTAGKTISFTYHDGGVDENSYLQSPRDESAVVSKKEAAYASAALLVRVFDDEITGGDVYVTFRNMEELRMEQYNVYFGGKDYESASFRGLVDADSGDVLLVENCKIALAEQETTESVDFDDPQWVNAGEETLAAAKQFIAERFSSQGNILDDSYYDGVQATFQTVDPICVDQYIHMEQGSSYSMRIRYPSMTIESLSAYPLGWDYCMSQTWYYEYMHPEEARSAYSALTNDELSVVATYAASLIGQAYTAPDATSRWQTSLQFVQDVWTHFSAIEKTRQIAEISSADEMTYPAGTQITLMQDDKENQLEGFYLADGSYVYADSETGKVEQGDFKKDFGTKFTACTVTTAVYVPRAGEYAVHIYDSTLVPVPTPSAEPTVGMLELTAGDYVVISEAAKALVGQDMTKALEITEKGDVWYASAFVQYVYKTVHVAMDGTEARSIDSISDPALIAGREIAFDYNSDHYWAIYVGDGMFVMLNPATSIVEQLSLEDILNNSEYSNIDVNILYAPNGNP